MSPTKLCAFLLAGAALAACGDNLAVPPDAAPPPPDAPAFVEAPHGTVPQVMSGGGPVLSAPTVVPIFFSGDDAARAQVETFLGQLATSSYWGATTAEYGVGQLAVGPSIVSSDPPPTTDDDLRAWLTANLDGLHPGWPAADASTIYTVFLPDGVVLNAGGAQSCSSFGGYHDETTTQAGAPLVYALLPRCKSMTAGPLDEVTEATSHELIEASTDPLPFTNPAYEQIDDAHFVWGRTPGAELGDMCEDVITAYQPLVGSFMVQRTWSNASAAAGHDPCVPVLKAPYVAASPELQDLTITTHGGAMIDTQGITIASGTPATLTVDLFSDAATFTDFSVQAMDVAQLLGGSPQLTFAWDNNWGHNGDKRTVTITRTTAGTSSRGGEMLILARVNNVVQSIWWVYVAGQ